MVAGDVGAKLLVVVGMPFGTVLGIARVVAHVLANEMEDDEVVAFEVYLAFVQEVVVIAEQSLVEAVKARVAQVKLRLAQYRVVEEEASREIVNRLPGGKEKLVGQERDLIARLAEKLREERIVAPLTLLANDVHRQHVLEHETREVPARHHVVELRQPSAALKPSLSWRVFLRIAIKLAMGLAVALANDEHYSRRAERA